MFIGIFIDNVIIHLYWYNSPLYVRNLKFRTKTKNYIKQMEVYIQIYI